MSTAPFRTLLIAIVSIVLVAGCAMGPDKAGPASAGTAWTDASLSAALAVPTRPQADKVRDADRKPAQLMNFMGVKPGMTALDAVAVGGYMTEVLSVAVGPKGKVYSQNPPAVYQLQGGAYVKPIEERHAGGRLPNVVRVDADLPASSLIAPGSVDVAITAQNFHDLYYINQDLATQFLKGIHATLKPGGFLCLTDHVGLDGANNAQLHRVPKHIAAEAAKAAGFVVEAESDLLAHPADDHTKLVFDPSLRGKTDQFTLKLRKPK
jgi:predicted methyltransferase